jgi:taurine-pyruvate aminotransferase
MRKINSAAANGRPFAADERTNFHSKGASSRSASAKEIVDESVKRTADIALKYGLIKKPADLAATIDKTILHHMSAHNDNPMIIASGEGSWVKDIDGNRYLDGMSGLWCVNVGHGRKEISETAVEQMMKIAYSTLVQSHVPARELAAKLNEWLDGEYRIFFSNSGSDANGVAFKIARQYHHQNGKPTKHKFISRHRAYHGNSMGALGATGQAQRKLKYKATWRRIPACAAALLLSLSFWSNERCV